MGAEEPAWRAKAAANLVEARRKNGRLGAKKSRGGCISCKERRVKCDEERPECQRCVRSGRRCEGYSPSPRSSASPPMQQSPSTALHVRDSERRTYDYFLSCASERLAGPLGKDFWHGYILQLAHAEPLVTDCLLAISTLYEHPQFMASFRRNPYVRTAAEAEKAERLGIMHPDVPPPPDEFHASALRKYNQAIRQFKEKIEQGSVAPYLMLTSCALFFCIEVIRDNVFAALALVNNGVEMLKHYGSQFTESQQLGLFKMFKLMFSRMGVTAATIGHALPTDDLPRLTSVGETSNFTTVAGARDALFAIMSDSRDFMHASTTWKEAFIAAHSACDSEHAKAIGAAEKYNMIETMYGASYKWTYKHETPPRQNYNTLPIPSSEDNSNESPDFRTDDSLASSAMTLELPEHYQTEPLSEMLTKLQSTQQHLLDQLEWWLRAFQGSSNHISDSDPRTAAFLLMYYHATFVWGSTRLKISETIFDDLTYHFAQIVHHADIHLEGQERATFTFETGAVAPLFLTATRCRIPTLRRRAIDLMKQAPRKECFHGAESTAEVACRFIEIEEEGLGHPIPDGSGTCAERSFNDDIKPSEHRRIHNLELMKTKGTQRHEITVTRYCESNGSFVADVGTFSI